MKKELQKEDRKRKLTKKQSELLTLAYSFRFVTSKSIAAYFGQSYLRAAQLQLNILCQLGYFDKRYDSSYRLQNRPAEYYLTPKAIPILRKQLTNPSELELKQLYARSKTSLRFINYSLTLFDVFIEFRRLYGNSLDFATKPQLNIDKFNYFPHPLPDAFMTLTSKTGDKRCYFIEYFDDDISIGIHGRKITNYMDYKISDMWDDGNLNFPAVIIVCQSPSMLKRAKKRIRYLDIDKYSEISFRLISLDKLKKLDSPEKHVWSDPIDRIKANLEN
jgi:hypothetical protein